MRDDVADVLHAAREEFRADVTESTASAVATGENSALSV